MLIWVPVEGIVEGQGCYLFNQADTHQLDPMQEFVDLRDIDIVDASSSNNIIEQCKVTCLERRYDTSAVRVGRYII